MIHSYKNTFIPPGFVHQMQIVQLDRKHLKILSGMCADSTNHYIITTKQNCSISLEKQGPGGVETVAKKNKWYFVYILFNFLTYKTTGLLSENSVTPFIGKDYTHFRRLGSIRTNENAEFLLVEFSGKRGVRKTRYLEALKNLSILSENGKGFSHTRFTNFIPNNVSKMLFLIRKGDVLNTIDIDINDVSIVRPKAINYLEYFLSSYYKTSYDDIHVLGYEEEI